MCIYNETSRRIVHLLLIAMIAVFVISFTAVTSPAFAAKKPAKVSGVTIYDVQDFSFTVSWNTAKNAKNYDVQYKKSSASKWSTYTRTSETECTVNVEKCDTKYDVRVRGNNHGKHGSWSAIKSVRTKLIAPKGVWPTHISNSVIEVTWPATSGAKEYLVTWGDGSIDTTSDVTKKTSFRIDNLPDSYGCFISIQSKNGKKYSNPVSVDLSTYDETCVLDLPSPNSSYYTLTKFFQHGSEYSMPAIYTYTEESEYYAAEDGFYFMDMELKELTVVDATLCQAYQTDIPIKTKTTYRVGDTFTAPDGTETTITGLRLTTSPNIVFEGCVDYSEAYDRIEEFQVDIRTADHSYNNPYIKWEHKPSEEW